MGPAQREDPRAELSEAAPSSLAELTELLRTRAHITNQRLTLVLAGSGRWTLSAATEALAAYSADKAVWLSNRQIPGWRLSLSRGDKLLGSEVDVLVYDAHGGLDPDSLGAALGALRGGGLLILLTPALQRWAQLPDPQADRVAVHPFAAQQVSRRYLHRFTRTLRQCAGVTILSESGPIAGNHVRHAPVPTPAPSAAIAKPSGHCRTPDQERAVEAILQTAYGRARRPLVLSSERGRGKSAALGIAVAALLASATRHILVTAPRRAAVDPIFQQANRLLPHAEVHRNRFGYREASLVFLPPDDLCRTHQGADLLLVDEAAGIPAPLLERLLLAYSRVVFATTVHGYEGTGRGFEVRFRRTLDKLTPLWREVRMETPIRWAPDDPLERLAARTLLLDAAPAADDQIADAYPATCDFRHLDRDTLADDEDTLAQLFGLLVLAHYQTRPMDLRHLLDGPNIRVYALIRGSEIAATALVAVEGGFEPDLGRDVFAGRRRPRGHLLPQTLSVHAGIEEATGHGYARVIRVAVHPAAQGRGIGRRLLAGIIDDARTLGLDCVGSSFGATGALLDFWTHCGFTAVHLGTSRNAASGAYAALVLRPLSPAGESLQALALTRLTQRLPTLLAGPLRHLEPAIAARLLQAGPQHRWSPDSRALREIEAFAYALHSYEAALPPLAALVRARLGDSLRAGKLEDAERDLLICKLLQHWDWGEVAQMLGLTGRGQALARLRAAIGKLIGDVPSGDVSSGDTEKVQGSKPPAPA